MVYCIAGNFQRRKTFANFVILWLFVKVFSAKFDGVTSLVWQKQAIHESFLHKNRTFYQFVKFFSLESFPLYGSVY